jgi:ribosome-associated toxin RatA of RatAB toxin-antitoxin module
MDHVKTSFIHHFKDYSPELIEIIISMLSVSPLDRPKAKDIVEMLSEFKEKGTTHIIKTESTKSPVVKTATKKTSITKFSNEKTVQKRDSISESPTSVSSKSLLGLFTSKVEAFEHLIHFEAPMEFCMTIIQDVEKYPEFLPSMNSAKVIEKANSSTMVEYTINAGITTISYVLAQEISSDGSKLKWHLVSGPFEKNFGFWSLTSLSENETLAKYNMTFGLSKFIPSSLTKYFFGQPFVENLSCFKKRIELKFTQTLSFEE